MTSLSAGTGHSLSQEDIKVSQRVSGTIFTHLIEIHWKIQAFVSLNQVTAEIILLAA